MLFQFLWTHLSVQCATSKCLLIIELYYIIDTGTFIEQSGTARYATSILPVKLTWMNMSTPSMVILSFHATSVTFTSGTQEASENSSQVTQEV